MDKEAREKIAKEILEREHIFVLASNSNFKGIAYSDGEEAHIAANLASTLEENPQLFKMVKRVCKIVENKMLGIDPIFNMLNAILGDSAKPIDKNNENEQKDNQKENPFADIISEIQENIRKEKTDIVTQQKKLIK